jgi:hypothetical protein
MPFDKATILDLLGGIDPNTRSRIVNSLVEGTSPEERERIIDRTATKKVSPYTSDRHSELMGLALGEDEDLANALATWIKKPANEEWLETVLSDITVDSSADIGGDQAYGIQGIIEGLLDLLRRGDGGLYGLDEAAGMEPPVSEFQTPPAMARGLGGMPPGLGRRAMGGIRGMLNTPPPEEIMPENLQGIM